MLRSLAAIGYPGRYTNIKMEKTIELYSLYLEAGKTLFLCQKLEHNITYSMYMLTQLGHEEFDNDLAEKVLRDQSIKTLGALIRVLKTKIDLPDQIESDLAEALLARNKFVHRFFIEEANNISKKEDLAKIVEKVKKIGRKVTKAQNYIEDWIERLTILHETLTKCNN